MQKIHLYTKSGVTGHVEFYVPNIEEQVNRLKTKGVVFTCGLHKAQALDFIDEDM